jgi:hypothetical protein
MTAGHVGDQCLRPVAPDHPDHICNRVDSLLGKGAERRHLDRVHVGTFTGPTGTFRKRTELSKPQRDLFAALGIPAPKQIIELATTSP